MIKDSYHRHLIRTGGQSSTDQPCRIKIPLYDRKDFTDYLQSPHNKVAHFSNLPLPFFSFLFLRGFSSVDSEVLSGAGRPVGGAGPEGDPVLRGLQLLGHRSVDERWPGSGHRRGPPG